MTKLTKTYKGLTANQILDSAHVGQSGAKLTEIFVTISRRVRLGDRGQSEAYVDRGERPDGFGGTVADVLVVITSGDGCVARLQMGRKADDRLAHLELIAGR